MYLNYAFFAPYILRFFRIAVMAIGGWYGICFLEKQIKQSLKKIYPDELRLVLIGRVAFYVGFFVIVAAIFYEFGLNISALLGAAGVVGVAVGFAAQTSVANIISGLFLMIERPFELGDILIISDIEGKVVSVNLFALTLRTHNGRFVRIPHEHLLKNSIINVTGEQSRRYEFKIKIQYEEDMNRAIKAIEHVIEKNPFSLNDPKPLIIAQSISGDSLELFVGVWVKHENIVQAKRTFLIDLKEFFDKEHIKFSIPRYKIEQ